MRVQSESASPAPVHQDQIPTNTRVDVGGSLPARTERAVMNSIEIMRGVLAVDQRRQHR